MHPPSTPLQRPRKRRAINACISCRSAKVRCDGTQPCKRCDRNDALCQYYNAAGKDPNMIRIEKLEAEVKLLQDQLNNSALQSRPISQSQTTPSRTVYDIVQPDKIFTARSQDGQSALERGLITYDDAFAYFTSFFAGSHYLVPIFSENSDSIASVASRSAYLFDAIVSVGCRAEQGFHSATFRQLQNNLREHLTALLVSAEQPKLEDVQAITLMAAYSDSGYFLIALALRFAIQLGLHGAVDQLLYGNNNRKPSNSEEEELYRLQRVWHGICNFEIFFSLDGGHVPSVKPRTTTRKIRALLKHVECTSVDIRLLSQLELNTIRADAYSDVLKQKDLLLLESEGILRSKIQNTTIELSLWLDEWTNVVSEKLTCPGRTLPLLNLRVQYEWALITLYLKVVSLSGIENIAIMSEFQKKMIRKSKEASTRHLRHLLEVSSSSTSPSESAPTYLNTFKWTMDYVWAKGAFSILLVLRLAILLRDPVAHILSLLRDAHRVLEELKKVTTGHIPYFQILQTSIEKCEAAITDYSQTGTSDTELTVSGPAESDFQGYAPNQFTFEWDFPGLNLKHMPLGWQELFVDIDNLF